MAVSFKVFTKAAVIINWQHRQVSTQVSNFWHTDTGWFHESTAPLQLVSVTLPATTNGQVLSLHQNNLVVSYCCINSHSCY